MNAADLRALLADHRPFHSAFQMDHFITAAAGGTTWGMYQQALRELRTRFDALKIDYLRLEELRIDMAEMEATVPETPVGERRLAHRRAKNLLEADTLDALARDREREFAHFYAQARALREQLGELTPERRRELEEDTWLYRAKAQAAEDYIARGAISPQTMQMLRALPPLLRAEALHEITRDPAELRGWWMNHQPDMPAIEPPPTTEIRGLLCP